MRPEVRFDEKVNRVFANSFVCDMIANLLTWNIHNPEIQKLLLKNDQKQVDILFNNILKHPLFENLDHDHNYLAQTLKQLNFGEFSISV